MMKFNIIKDMEEEGVERNQKKVIEEAEEKMYKLYKCRMYRIYLYNA